MIDPSIIDSMINNRTSLCYILPGFIIIGTLLIILLSDLLISNTYKHWGLRTLPVGGVGLALYATVQLGGHPRVQAGLPLFNHLLQLDLWAIFWQGLFMGITLCILFTFTQKQLQETSIDITTIYIVMLLGALLGSYFLTMAQNWLVIYLSLTLMTLAATVLVYNPFQPLGVMASLHYGLYHTIGAAMMCWGMSYLYGSTGTLGLTDTNFLHSSLILPKSALLVGLLLALSGIFIKLGSVPFHYWMAHVYQGASIPVIAYLTTLPRLAAVSIMVRLCKYLLPQFDTLSGHLQSFIALIIILTLAIGHIAAIIQCQPRLILVYGSIAQGGLLLAGIVNCGERYAMVCYYSLAYGIMNLAAWVGLDTFRRFANGEHIYDYAGLGRQFPLVGICFVITMLALAGIPPTVGFIGKLFIFSLLWETVQIHRDPLSTILFVTGLIGSIASLYYYLKLPYILFLKPIQQPTPSVLLPWGEQFILILLTAMLPGLFLSASTSVAILRQWSMLP